MSKSIMQILEDAANLVEKNWVRNSLAVNQRGYGVPPLSGEAVRFCAVGSVHRAAGEQAGKSIELALSALRKELEEAKVMRDSYSIESWNDNRCQSGEQLAGFLRSAAKKQENNA